MNIKDAGFIGVSCSLPDFRVFGFHSGRRLDVVYEDGSFAESVAYHGYGMFGEGLREDVSYWRLSGGDR